MRAAPWLAVLMAGVAAAQAPPPRRAFVKLPLAEYLQLVERAEAADRTKALPTPRPEQPLAELLSQRNRAVLDERTARVTSTYEVELRGRPTNLVALSFTGHVETARVTPAGSATVALEGGRLRLVAPDLGRYRIEVVGVAGMQVEGGVSRLALAPVEAPVATTEVELPAGLAWSCPGATVASDEVRGERRVVQLALRRGVPHAFEARREVKGEEQTRTLARAVVVTLVSLRPEGARRHDVVLYEVARGALGSFEVGVPVGWEVDRLASDEGELPPVVDGERVVAQRATQLTGTGWMAMTGPSQGWGAVSLVPVEPGVEVRARYVAVAATVAAEVEPEPRGGWQRVDLEDLPEAVRVAADGMRLAAAWQSVGDGKEGRLAVAVLPAAGVRETVVGSRETTTLLTREGTVLHRERLVLGRAGSGVEVRLGSGATLWSASVGGQSVRHLERDGLVVVPVALGTAAGTEVEVVVVERQAIGEGRTRVGITLPELMAPVLEHRWRLLLPEEHRYRFAGGSLAPVGGGFAPTRDGEQGAVPAARTGQPGTEPAQTGRAVPGRAAAAVASLVGRISNERDQPVRGVTVDLVRDGKRVATVSSGADGSYGFAGAEPGEYTVSCRFWGLQPRTAWVIARTGVVSTVNLVMPVEVEPAIDGVTRPGAPTVTSAPHADRTSTVGGRVYDARKHPLQGVLVAVTSPALQGVRTTVTSTTGEFRFQFLPSGTYTLRAERQGFAPREETIDLAPGARMDTSLSLSEAAVALADGVPGGVVSQVPMDYDQALAEKVPLENRGLASYVSVAPAAPAGQAPPSISGAMAHENLYLVNGVVQTDRVRPPGKVQVITRSRTDPVESHAFRWEASNLMQGLVGGVRPVAVSVPENGKVLRLAGALPPRQVRVELDVRSED